MQSIQDIIDTTLSLGFSYFYGLGGDDEGYLRRMLHTNPSLDALYAQLKDDINFIEDADIDYFRNKTQLNAFKSLKKYLKLAKEYVKTQLDKKKKGSKSEQEDIQNEIKELDKEVRDGFIEPEERDYAIRILLKPSMDDLSEIKSKFEDIDHKVKQELKHVGFEEEEEKEEDEDYILPEEEGEYFSNEEKSEHDNEVYVSRFEPSESKESYLDKIVDEGNRRYSMREFNEIYEAIINPKQQDAAQQKQALAISTMVKQYEQQRKSAAKNPQQMAAAKKNNAAKLQQLGVDPKLIAQLQADDKL